MIDNIFYIFYVFIFCSIVVITLYGLLYYKFNSSITDEFEIYQKKLENDKIQSLLNGSGINNIPQLNIVSTNSAVTKANSCGAGPVLISDKTDGFYDIDCVKLCANSSAKALIVHGDEDYIYDSSKLNTGTYCKIGPKPECNMNTTYAIMTINSVTCLSKFPRLVGGPLGNTIVACNNSKIYDPQNYLFDYKYLTRFDPFTTIVSSEDELLPTGEYRFRCKYNGVDDNENNYIEHPYDRLHPIINYCASNIYRAHPDVKTIFRKTIVYPLLYECDCGNYNETRVKHIFPDDKTSQCLSLSMSLQPDVKKRKLAIVPYKCFTLFSNLNDVGRLLPCPPEQFTRKGNKATSVTIPLNTTDDALIEHPYYEKFTEPYASVELNKEVC